MMKWEISSKDEMILAYKARLSEKPKTLLFFNLDTRISPNSKLMHEREV